MPSSDSDADGGAHLRALEALYASEAINAYFPSQLHVPCVARAVISCTVGPDLFHGAGAGHGAVYFKYLDDAAFYAASSRITDFFLLTTAFHIIFTRPLGAQALQAEGRWISGDRRVIVAESRLVDEQGVEYGYGRGTFTRSRKRLCDLPAYAGICPDQGLSPAR